MSGRSDHVLVCGSRGIGHLTASQLALAGDTVVVIDPRPDPQDLASLVGYGVEMVTANPKDPGVLSAADIMKARAVVCVQDNDIDTLETALLVFRMAPHVRLVAQLANPAVGRALSSVTGPGTVLDGAGLAAPSIIEACRRRATHRFAILDQLFVLTELTAETTTTIRRAYGDLAPIAVAPAKSDDLIICPSRDHELAPGDRVTVIGTEEEIADVRGSRFGGRREVQRRGLLAQVRTAVIGVFTEVDRSLRLALVAFAAMMALTTVVLRLGYRVPSGAHISWLNAFYFTVVTDTTVGYGDFHYSGQRPWLVGFGILDILSGAVIVTTMFALVTNLLVNRRIAAALGRKRIEGLSDHIVLVGLGAIGMRVLEGLLDRGLDVVVVEKDESGRFLSQARAIGAPVVIGDATLPQTLDLVAVDRASAIGVLTSSDLTNLEVGLALRDRLGADSASQPVVIRLLDPGLAATVEESFGFNHVRSTAALAAPWFVGAALGLDVLDTFYVERQPFLLARLEVREGSGLDGATMQGLSSRTRVLAIDRADGSGLEHPPRRGTTFAAGDFAYAVGPYEELLQVLQRNKISTS